MKLLLYVKGWSLDPSPFYSGGNPIWVSDRRHAGPATKTLCDEFLDAKDLYHEVLVEPWSEP